MNKLVIAVIQDKDSAKLMENLVGKGHQTGQHRRLFEGG